MESRRSIWMKAAKNLSDKTKTLERLAIDVDVLFGLPGVPASFVIWYTIAVIVGSHRVQTGGVNERL
jgi:hypothetical protein